jgi:hypothetical protein
MAFLHGIAMMVEMVVQLAQGRICLGAGDNGDFNLSDII